MNSVGKALKDARLRQQIELKTVAEKLKIRYKILSDIEEGVQPTETVVEFKAFKRFALAYAKFLKLDPNRIRLLIDESSETDSPSQEKGSIEEDKDSSKFLFNILIIGFLLLGILILIFINKAQNQYARERTPTNYVHLTPIKKARIVALENTQFNVTIDDQQTTEEVLTQDNSRQFTFNNIIKFHFPNAGVIRVFYNEKLLGTPTTYGKSQTLVLPMRPSNQINEQDMQ